MDQRRLQSVVKMQDFSFPEIEEIFRCAAKMKANPRRYSSSLSGRILAALFYEPSTRTRLSFESAMLRLGGSVIGTEGAGHFSSKSKGETLEDTVRVVSGYADVIVLRYYKEGGAERAKNFSSVPIINAGDGPGQHPSQALLDAFSIREHFRRLEGLVIAMAGDLANGRTVHSLCYLIAKHFPDNELIFVSPEAVAMPEHITEYLDRKGMRWSVRDCWDDVLSKVHVVYQTRVQSERFLERLELFEQVKREAERLTIRPETLAKMREDAIILHPLPRVGEIAFGVDADPRARYFDQARNGLPVRMALLYMILHGY